MKLNGDVRELVVLRAWTDQARRDNHADSHIRNVLTDAKSGDRSHMLRVLRDNCVAGAAADLLTRALRDPLALAFD